MKVLLIGAKGQLGTDLHRALERQQIAVLPFTHAELDVCHAERTAATIASTRPDVVINTAAFHKVEECENQPAKALEVNALAVQALAKACGQFGSALVHFSTDYVFDGSKQRPYSESDTPAPLNVYGVSKVAGEHMVALNCDRYFIVRTSGLYGRAGSSGKGGNFVEMMTKRARNGDSLRVVRDQVLTPTFTADLADMITQLIRTSAYGLYHITSEGQCSWYEFAKRALELQGLRNDLRPVTSEEFPSSVRRPPFSVLSKERLNSIGLGKMAHWEDALRRYLQDRGAR